MPSWFSVTEHEKRLEKEDPLKYNKIKSKIKTIKKDEQKKIGFRVGIG